MSFLVSMIRTGTRLKFIKHRVEIFRKRVYYAKRKDVSLRI